MNTTQQSKKIQQKQFIKHAQATDSYSFFNLLTGSKLLSMVEEQLPDHRERTYPPTATLALFLSQAMSSDASCQNTVNHHAVERAFNGLTPCSIKTGGYCRARQRLPLDMVAALVKQTGQLIAEQTPANWTWQGRPVKLVDGTTVTLPDTKDNQKTYPQQSRQKQGLGFPIARMVAIISLSSGAILDGAMGAYKGKGASEHSLFRQILDGINLGDIVLADRYYCSYFIIALLLEKGVDVVFQQHATRHTDFRKGKNLGARDHIVKWKKPKQKPHWMTVEAYEDFTNELTLREFKSGKKVIVTTLLSDKEAPKKEISYLYNQRWHIELDLRNIKTTLGMEQLSCKTPGMNEKEMYVYFLAYNLIRLIMAEAAIQTGLMPRQLSFKHTLQIWLIWSQKAFAANDKIDVLFRLIAARKVGERPNRIEPRAVKRRPKPCPLLMKPRSVAQAEIRNNAYSLSLK